MEHLPDHNSKYKYVDYWDERYQTEESFEWFGDFSTFQHLLENFIKKEDSILVLGCGNSGLSVDLYKAGYRSISNIDARQLSFPDGSFDVVLEKATLDAMLVEEKDPWRVSNDAARLIHQVLTEVSRVLKPGGRFLSLTFAQPHFRRRLYASHRYGWSVRHHHYGDGFHYFLYVLTKGEELSPEDAALERKLLEEAVAPPAPVPTLEEDTEDFLDNINL